MGSSEDTWIFFFVCPKLLYALSCLNLPSVVLGCCFSSFLLRCTFIILWQCILSLVPAGHGGEAGENRLLSLLLIEHLLELVVGGISVYFSSPAVASVSLNGCCIQEE